MSDAKHCDNWLARLYTRAQTISIAFMDMGVKRYVSQQYVGYQIVDGKPIGVQKCQIELQDGTVKDVWEVVSEQLPSPASKTFYLEEPPMDIRIPSSSSAHTDETTNRH